MGVNIPSIACCTSRSLTVGIPNNLMPPCGFGISIPFTGFGFHHLIILRLISSNFGLTILEVLQLPSCQLPPFPAFCTTCLLAFCKFDGSIIRSIKLLVYLSSSSHTVSQAGHTFPSLLNHRGVASDKRSLSVKHSPIGFI